jgi:hypothetical protein
MFNGTTVANVFAAAARALVIALFTIGMAVNSSWAEPATGNYSKRIITAQGCIPNGYACPSGLNQQCCEGFACVLTCCANNLPGSFVRVCFPSRKRGEVCSSDNECASGACDANRAAPVDSTGNNYHYGLCE